MAGNRNQGSDNKGDAAAQKAGNRARSGTRSGSSMIATHVARMPALDWADIEGEAEHIADIAAKMSHVQSGAQGWLTTTLNVPLEYAHDLLDIQQNARDGMIYVRVFHVSFDSYLEVVGGHMDDKAGWLPGPDPNAQVVAEGESMWPTMPSAPPASAPPAPLATDEMADDFTLDSTLEGTLEGTDDGRANPVVTEGQHPARTLAPRPTW